MVQAREIVLRPGHLDRTIERYRRLSYLHRDIVNAMRIKITEPVFFFGQLRKAGDVIEAPVGPYRTQVIPGGLKRIPQFVEMPEEIATVLQNAAAGAESTAVSPAVQTPVAAPAAATPQPATFAEATASVLKPNAAAKPVSSTAALLTSLAGRRRKLEQTIITEAQAYAKELVDIETGVPTTFAKAKASLADRKASLGEIDSSLADFAGANDIDPLQK